MGSILVWDQERLHVNSEALIRIARELPRPWSWLRHLRLLPLLFRDSIYTFIGRHRYAWFGLHDTCRIPFSADERKFLDLNDPVYKDAEHADLSQNTADPDQR
jgi:predicted DCC family thiol-disulfide oxidoreductase YuxK